MLSKKIKEYLDRCVASNFTGKSSEHPIIVLNAIKNIIGDNRTEPSNKLLELLKNKAHQFPAREDDQSILNEVAKDGVGLTIFVSENMISSYLTLHILKKMKLSTWRKMLLTLSRI